jgi:hypothetical protein
MLQNTPAISLCVWYFLHPFQWENSPEDIDSLIGTLEQIARKEGAVPQQNDQQKMEKFVRNIILKVFP